MNNSQCKMQNAKLNFQETIKVIVFSNRGYSEFEHPLFTDSKLYNERDFKACEVWETAAYWGVCEDFEHKRNAEITSLDDFLY